MIHRLFLKILPMLLEHLKGFGTHHDIQRRRRPCWREHELTCGVYPAQLYHTAYDTAGAPAPAPALPSPPPHCSHCTPSETPGPAPSALPSRSSGQRGASLPPSIYRCRGRTERRSGGGQLFRPISTLSGHPATQHNARWEQGGRLIS